MRSENLKWKIALTIIYVLAAVAGSIGVFYCENRFWIFGASIATAPALFSVREINQIVYGSLEILFAGIALWDAASKGRGDFSSDFSPDFQTYQWRVILLQIGGAIFVLIRGLDNCRVAKLPQCLFELIRSNK